MLLSPLEIEFLRNVLGIDIPYDPYELAQMLPELYYISQNIHKGAGLPPGYASIAATNTSLTRDLNRRGIEEMPANYGRLQSPGVVSPELSALAVALNRTMQPPQITGPRPQDETQLDRDLAANPRGIQQGQHFAAAAPVAFDLPSYSPNGGGYSLINALPSGTLPSSVRYAYGANY